MKPILYNDVLAAVSFASTFPRVERRDAVAEVIRDAELAADHARATGRAHPVFGDGTLMAAVMRHRAHGETGFRSADALSAWIEVLTALRDRCG